jgi:hypothetical protein
MLTPNVAQLIHRKLSYGVLLCALLLVTPPSRVLAGPPFQTDDPEPVDLGHYEFYIFSGVDGTPLETDPTGPAFEFNWGALPNTQLHAILAFGAIVPSDNPVAPSARYRREMDAGGRVLVPRS